MFLLLCNDDGYHAQGIRALYAALKPRVENIAIMAPAQDHSGKSHALSLDQVIMVKEHEPNIYAVSGTPADSAYLAATEFFNTPPDWLISGINMGANSSDDVVYSGTVAAAFEGRRLAHTPLALSNVSFLPCYLEDNAQIVSDLLEDLACFPKIGADVVNINFPDCPKEEIKGIALTHLAKRLTGGSLLQSKNPRNKEYYWIGRAGDVEKTQGTDIYALERNFISITPLFFDFSLRERKDVNTEELITWLNNLNARLSAN